MKARNLLLGVLVLILLSLSYDSQGQSKSKKTSNDKYELEHLYDAIEYRCIGPWRGGRSCAVAGVPGKPNLFYFGATGGGVWKTNDGGRSWENISDGYFGGSIGSVAVANSDHNVIYAGGGEKTVRGNVSYGYGVWKSEDAGKTWESKGLNKSRHISRIRIHPTNSEVLYAAVMGNLFASSPERGIFKSTDGGTTWKKTLFINNDVGCVDLCMDPTNPRILFATSWRIRRTPYSLSSGGEGSGIWKSTDAGETWKNISESEGLPKDTLGIIGVAVSPVNSDRIFALIESKTGGLFRSDDGGNKWTKINENRNLRQRAWYYTRVYADTEDADVVYVVNVAYHKSKDGGKSFTRSSAPHGDHHDLWIAPEDPKRMIMGDDGGAQITYDGGQTWSTYYNQPTSQFYRVTTDNHFPYRIYAAQQDNSTIRIAHRTNGRSIGERHWEPTAGGESAHIAIDPENNEIVYGGSYDGYLTRRDHSTEQVRAINVWPDNPMGYGAEGMKYRFQWNFPIFFSRHNPNRLYTASNHLHVTEDEGQSWEIISPDLTRNDPSKLKSSGGPITQDNTSVEYYCTIFAGTESIHEEGVLWVGSDDGLVHISKDGGANWTNITPPNMPKWAMINCLEPDPFEKGGAYIAATLYKGGDFQPYLYKTKNYGKTWQKITTGIKNDHFTRAIRADHNKQGVLYAGTESGMYISFNDGSNWHPFQLNLPIVPITDLALKDENLIVATQGRSLWVIDDLTPIYQLQESKRKEVRLFKPKDSYRMGGRQNKKVKGAGINHPGGVMVYYYLKDKVDTTFVKMEFLDEKNNLIAAYSTKEKKKQYKLKPEEGANLFVWNMQYKPAKKLDGMILWWGSLNGPKAIPGKYQVRLILKNDTIMQPFNILKDPRSSATSEDFQKQSEFIQSIVDKTTEAHNAIDQLRDIRKQTAFYKDRLKEDKETYGDILKQGAKIDSLLTATEKELYQTKNRSNQDPLNFPIKLTNKLAHLNSLTQIGDYPPTNQAIEVRDELIKLINRQLTVYKEVLEKEVPIFNELIRNNKVDAILLKPVKEE